MFLVLEYPQRLFVGYLLVIQPIRLHADRISKEPTKKQAMGASLGPADQSKAASSIRRSCPTPPRPSKSLSGDDIGANKALHRNFRPLRCVLAEAATERVLGVCKPQKLLNNPLKLQSLDVSPPSHMRGGFPRQGPQRDPDIPGSVL